MYEFAAAEMAGTMQCLASRCSFIGQYRRFTDGTVDNCQSFGRCEDAISLVTRTFDENARLYKLIDGLRCGREAHFQQVSQSFDRQNWIMRKLIQSSESGRAFPEFPPLTPNLGKLRQRRARDEKLKRAAEVYDRLLAKDLVV